jgi:hypothetical protein
MDFIKKTVFAISGEQIFSSRTTTPCGHAEGIDTAPTNPVIRLNYYATKGVIASTTSLQIGDQISFFIFARHSSVVHLNFNRLLCICE